MSRLPVVLLPPSEGKAPGGDGAPWDPATGAFPGLADERRRVAEALAAAMAAPEAERRALLGVKGAALAAATAADLCVLGAPTLPAVRRFTGVLYDALDAASLTGVARRRLGRQVVIFSGLLGASLAGDPVPDHKLKMGVALPPLGTLSTWWRPSVTAALAPVVARRVVWDLLPGEHAAAWSPPDPGRGQGAPSAVLSVRFLDEGPRQRGAERSLRAVSHWNKLLKGALVRHVLETGADEPAALARFEHPHGYTLDPSLTEVAGGRTLLSFVRPAP